MLRRQTRVVGHTISLLVIIKRSSHRVDMQIKVAATITTPGSNCQGRTRARPTKLLPSQIKNLRLILELSLNVPVLS